MLYHGVGQGNSISLSSDPLLNQWRQLPSNPVVPDPKDRPAIANETDRDSEGGAPYASWDPHGWVEGDTYYAIFGGKRPAVFKAAELNKWSYVGDLFGTYLPDVSKSEDVSCPDFFTLGGKKVLLCISHHWVAVITLAHGRMKSFIRRIMPVCHLLITRFCTGVLVDS